MKNKLSQTSRINTVCSCG
uniref:Uncharacterized protein n=1 Tax=Anguilla anguilla TaxID=7936 RepID=A0A0E9T8B5_ANGAN